MVASAVRFRPALPGTHSAHTSGERGEHEAMISHAPLGGVAIRS
jgi:hypothetical protein